MILKKLLPLLALFCFLSFSSSAFAYPWNDTSGWEDIPGYEHLADEINYYLSLTHLNPTYMTFAGQSHDTGELFNATIYMDINRNYSENSFGRNYYARYISGNIFGGRSNIEGDASDYLTIPTQEGYAWFGGGGEFYNYSKPFSSFRVGDYLNYHAMGVDINMTLIDWFEVPAGSTPVPEPATCLLISAGLAGVGYLRRRKMV